MLYINSVWDILDNQGDLDAPYNSRKYYILHKCQYILWTAAQNSYLPSMAKEV